MDKVEFRQTVTKDTVLKFKCEKLKTGITSVCYHVDVTNANSNAGDAGTIFSTNVTLVRIDENGGKQAAGA